MFNKKIIAMGLLTCLGVLAISSEVNAADVEATSEGRVKFTPAIPKDPSPFDPTDPSFPPAEIVPEEKDSGLGTPGVLRFERVPNFSFEDLQIIPGEQTAEVLDEAYKLKSDPTTIFYAAPTVEITDGRGNAPGWKASVRTDGIFTSAGLPSVKGIIKLNNGVARSYTEGVPALQAPEVNSLEITNTFKQFALATEGNGNASWGITYHKDATLNRPANNGATRQKSDAITLTVPSGQIITKEVEYTTSIVWQLADTAD